MTQRTNKPGYIVDKISLDSYNKAVEKHSLYDISVKAEIAPDMFSLYVGDFLDAYYSATADDRSNMIAQEPVMLRPYRLSVYLAAMAEHLAYHDGLPVPEWTKNYSLETPYFYGGERMKAILLIESPIAFRRRNLYVSENALSRC